MFTVLTIISETLFIVSFILTFVVIPMIWIDMLIIHLAYLANLD